MHLLGLNIHPLKSGAIREVQSADVLPRGLVDDRSWMLVDGDGRLVSARELHSLFRIVGDTPSTDCTVTAALRLRAPGMEDLLLSVPDGRAVRVRLHSHELMATPGGDRADEWIRRALGRDDLRVMWCHDPSRRPLPADVSETDDHTAFADAFPVTLASHASLARLNEWIALAALARGEEAPTPLPIQRFRPNLVIDGAEPFAEDTWSTVIVGEVTFRVTRTVDRCVMTTIDPATLSTGKEPIRTLARHRLVERKTKFAIHLIPRTSGLVRVGDPVTVC